MKIFVTGGTGHVGESVLRLLSEAGHDSRVLTRNPEFVRGRVGSIPRVYPALGDITTSSVEVLAGLMAKMEAVIHIVGIIIEKGTAGFEAVHTEGTRRIVEAAKRARASSDSVRAVPPSIETWLSSYSTISLASPRWPAREAASWLMPSIRSPSPAIA